MYTPENDFPNIPWKMMRLEDNPASFLPLEALIQVCLCFVKLLLEALTFLSDVECCVQDWNSRPH